MQRIIIQTELRRSPGSAVHLRIRETRSTDLQESACESDKTV